MQLTSPLRQLQPQLQPRIQLLDGLGRSITNPGASFSALLTWLSGPNLSAPKTSNVWAERGTLQVVGGGGGDDKCVLAMGTGAGLFWVPAKRIVVFMMLAGSKRVVLVYENICRLERTYTIVVARLDISGFCGPLLCLYLYFSVVGP